MIGPFASHAVRALQMVTPAMSAHGLSIPKWQYDLPLSVLQEACAYTPNAWLAR